MKTTYLGLLVICCAIVFSTRAQHFAPFAAKIDVSMALRNGLGGSLEWQFSPRAAIAVQGSWEKHNRASDFGLFNGELVAAFAELKTDTFIGLHLNTLTGSSMSFEGEGRPLPILPEFIPISSLNLRLGHRFIFGKKRSKWQLFLQPSLSLVRHQFYAVKQTFVLHGTVGKATIYGTWPERWTERKLYKLFQERQSMLAHTKWLPGLAYDIGISRRFGQRWYIEARLSGMHNLEIPYVSPMAAPARSALVRPHLFIGYSIGRIR
jgi:hypothetical protein